MIALLFCVMPHKTRGLSFHQYFLAGSGAAFILVEFSVLQAIWVEKLIAASLTSHASQTTCALPNLATVGVKASVAHGTRFTAPLPPPRLIAPADPNGRGAGSNSTASALSVDIPLCGAVAFYV
jgi:hypothetical protein